MDTVAPGSKGQRRSERLRQVSRVDYTEEQDSDDDLPLLLSGSSWKQDHLDRLGVDFPLERIDLNDILQIDESDFSAEAKRRNSSTASLMLTACRV
jgi:hypothetical protein